MNLASSIATNGSLSEALNNRTAGGLRSNSISNSNNEHEPGVRAQLNSNSSSSSGSSSNNESNQNNHSQVGDKNKNTVEFLNSRIAELHQRYTYLNNFNNTASTNNNNTTTATAPQPLDNKNNNIIDHDIDVQMKKSCSGSSITSALDSKYGRMSDFGWLVVGNVGKIVGITLTSITTPPKEPTVEEKKSTLEDEDLMRFNDLPDTNETANKQNNNINENNNNNSASILMQSSQSSSSSFSASEFEQIRPDRKCVRGNYNLRGHLDEVILVKWNELYQKLATIDSKGNVLIWCKINEKFTIQTPFYNRTKSVADFKWSNDGKTALICYTDSFILVGSATGQRHWHSMLNLDDYHITCASWTPNDEQLLLGVSNGNMVVIDLPRSELTELVVNQTNIRTMCWSTCEMSLKSVCNYVSHLDSIKVKPVELSSNNPVAKARKMSRMTSTVVNHRRLDRDCSIFSRIRFCVINQRAAAAAALMPTNESGRVNELNQHRETAKCAPPQQQQQQHQHNILAIDFANNTIKLYDGSVEDPNPKTIHTNLESYLMQWSSDGRVLAVAGFNIHTTAPSVGCLRCRYLNSIKFFSQTGKLIYEQALNYTRYPITAFTWAHDDRRLFVATGPRLHCAKVFFGIAPLSLLAASCLQRHTKLPDKSELLELMLTKKISNHRQQQHQDDNNHSFTSTLTSWQSYNCPIKLNQHNFEPNQQQQQQQLASGSKKINSLNNANVFQVHLPFKVQMSVDELFAKTIRQPFDEELSLNDIIWHVPKQHQRYYCTLICYTSEREISTTGYHYQQRNDLINNDYNHASEHYKIFVLYVEFQGSLIPILRARRVGFLKPEFVIFDPNDNQLLKMQRQKRKVSDLSNHMQSYQNAFYQNFIHQVETNQQNNQQQLAAAAPAATNDFRSNLTQSGDDDFCNLFAPSLDNCSDLHLYSEPRASASSSQIGGHSLSDDAENYYNFECDTVNRRTQAAAAAASELRTAELISARSHHQEPVALPLNTDPYLLYHMMSGLASPCLQQQQHQNPLITPKLTSTSSKRTPNSAIQHQHQQQRRFFNKYNIGNNYKMRSTNHSSNSTSSSLNQLLTENNELIRIQSNIWGTKFKLINATNSMIKQRSILGSVVYKASILHLQPRQIFLNIKDMSNYCCLCSRHHHQTNRQRKNKKSPPQPVVGSGKKVLSNNNNNKCNKFSLLDLPNNEPQQQQLVAKSLNQTPTVQRRSRFGLNLSCKHEASKKKEDKVMLSFGGSVGVVPKLDFNQEYRRQQQVVSRFKAIGRDAPSTSRVEATKVASKSRKHSLNSDGSLGFNSPVGSYFNSNPSSNIKTYNRHQHNHHASTSSSEIHSIPCSSTIRAKETGVKREKEENILKKNPITKQQLKLDFLTKTSNNKSCSSSVHNKKTVNLNNKNGTSNNASSRSTSNLQYEFNDYGVCGDDDDDDVLTLSLSQGDQVKVEMSSLRSLNTTPTPASTSNKDTNINQFLAENKTLKSIQTITKMIVDLSSKADDESEEENKDDNNVLINGNEAANKRKDQDLDDELSSPAKLAKLSPSERLPIAGPAACYVAPATPVHRPRRMVPTRAPSVFGGGSSSSSIEPFVRTQSAHNTPAKWCISSHSRQRTNNNNNSNKSRSNMFSQTSSAMCHSRQDLCSPTDSPLATPSCANDPLDTPLPAPPPTMRLSSRISSSAKRFFDGSLRSLYGGVGGGSLSSMITSSASTDAECEDSEPLVAGASKTSRVLQRELERRLAIIRGSVGGGGQSQPSSPMKKRTVLRKQTSDLSSFRLHLINKLSSSQGQSDTKTSTSCEHQKHTCSRSKYCSRCNEFERIIGEKVLAREIVRRQESTSFKVENNEGDDHDDDNNYNEDEVDNVNDDTASCSSDDADEISEPDDNYDDLSAIKIVRGQSSSSSGESATTRGKNKSSSVKDLRELGRLRLAAAHQELKCMKKSANLRVDQQQQQQHNKFKSHRRKSICMNSSCCCAKEFKLNNRAPIWNESSQIYQLDFGGRVTQESAKNLQIDFEGNLVSNVVAVFVVCIIVVFS